MEGVLSISGENQVMVEKQNKPKRWWHTPLRILIMTVAMGWLIFEWRRGQMFFVVTAGLLLAFTIVDTLSAAESDSD